MSNLQQNYDFNYQQPSTPEDEKVRLLKILWIVFAALPVALIVSVRLLVRLFSFDSVIDALPENLSDMVWVGLFLILGLLIVSHHVIAIVGKIKYRYNKTVHTIFVVDMIMLAVLIVILLKMAVDNACDMCDHFG
ncbi:MAG: hypothetical protein IJI47_04295 [Eubacterium sp.]|nr:hypothetical protein [Eubacterium sp.]MBR0412768.1 hypothetical protein [Eubacterium sp.]